jgi:SynChlorMet cassette radical SAM/SPASM protein ScmF
MNEVKKQIPPLKRIYFYLTGNCNLRCRHCWIAPTYIANESTKLFLDVHHFKSIIKQAKPLGLNSVKLTGGEPLLHPNIFEIIEIVKQEDLELTIETNGTLCSLELSQLIRSCRKPFISVSLDGSTKETHEYIRGVNGCFNEALQGIVNLVKAGLKPQLIMSIMNHNKGEIESFVRLVEQLCANSVKFNLVQPTSRGKAMHEAAEVPSVEELIEIGRWVERTLIPTTHLRVFYSYPMAFRSLNRIFIGDSSGSSTCGILTVLGVLSDGSFALCGIGKVVKEFIFGNVNTDSLQQVWENNSILNEIRYGLPHRIEGICKECVMVKMCKGSCIAQNYYTDNSLWAPFWFCKEADNKGLFPQSRKMQHPVIADNIDTITLNQRQSKNLKN